MSHTTMSTLNFPVCAAQVDKLASVARKVDTVKLVMQENVDAALQNCVKLESIEKAAGEFLNCCCCINIFTIVWVVMGANGFR
jgi:hypothetical protein